MAYAVNDITQSAFAGPTPAATTLDPSLVSGLFNTIDTSTQDFGQAQSNQVLAQGDTAEAGAYGNVETIAQANARLAQAAGQVEQAQQGITIRQAQGAERAAQASNGFGAGGSAAALLRESTRQGQLEQSITGINSTLQAGGYQQQGAAAAAEAAAANTAANAATSVANTETQIGQQSRTNATNEAAILANMLGINVPGTAAPNPGILSPLAEQQKIFGTPTQQLQSTATGLSAASLQSALQFLQQPPGTLPATPTATTSASSLSSLLASFAQQQGITTPQTSSSAPIATPISSGVTLPTGGYSANIML